MRKWIFAAAGLGLAGLAGCNSFLDAKKAVQDPNNPTSASRNQLFAGVQANTFGNEEGPLPMIICQWMQQCGGVNGRFVDQQATYSIQNTTFDTPFSNIYQGGGLIGIRAVEASASADGDKVYLGIAEVFEAMDMMYAADIWGNVPYREATGANPTPAFDGQMQIYSDLLTLLDKAITDIAGAGNGPGVFDLIYGGDKTKWTQAAHTLKARIYLHQVEKLGNAQYTSALAEAKLGISAPANDWKTRHSTASAQDNMWEQFQNTSGFGTDLVAGAALVNIMLAQNDTLRLPQYFGRNSLGGFGGYDVVTGTTPPAQISTFTGAGRNSKTFSQPIITFDETQLIIAEASLQTGATAAAATALNTVRAQYGKPAIAAPTLNDIMTEKYIALFQNREVWNDYKRTCLPVLHPARNKTVIPGRVYYGITEEQTNPNTPPSSAQSLTTVRNPNDPNACPP